MAAFERPVWTFVSSAAAACTRLLMLAAGSWSCAPAVAQKASIGPSDQVIVRRGHMLLRVLPDATCEAGNASSTVTTCRNAIAQKRVLVDEIEQNRKGGAPEAQAEENRMRVEREIARDEMTLQVLSAH